MKWLKRTILGIGLIALTLAFSSNASADTKTWTSDTDWRGPGVKLENLSVVGSGDAAYVQLGRAWLEGYNHCVPMDIVNSSGKALTDYQVKITVDRTIYSGMQTDFGDVRFTNKEGNVELPYFLQNSTVNPGIFFVKVDSILPGTNYTAMYMYYDTVGASVSSGDFNSTFTKDYNESGLIGLWHMDEGVGTAVSDASGNGNHGVATNSSWVGYDGGVWGARQDVSFSSGDCLTQAANGAINCGHGASLNIAYDEMTIEAWIKPDEAFFLNYSTIVARDRIGNRGYQFSKSKYGGNMLSFLIGDNTGIQALDSKYSLTWETNKWYHVAVVYKNKTATFYQNGKNVGSKTSTLAGNIYVLEASDLKIGRQFGIIDEVRISKRALAPEEIMAHYERRRYASPEPEARIGKEQKK